MENAAILLLKQSNALLSEQKHIANIIGFNEHSFDSLPSLLSALLGAICGNNQTIAGVANDVFSANPYICDLIVSDVTETAKRNFEPGNIGTTLLFSRGIFATIAHRLAHHIWQDGDHNLALAIKSTIGLVFNTDIHPAAKIGRGFWLDHGLGFVMGETAIIKNNVSIWHNVTLGSTFNFSNEARHPIIEDNAIIGAGATLLGNITIGKAAAVAAGAIVLNDVPDGNVAAGQKATIRGTTKVSFTNPNI